jgi:trk system potassium uptake protein TrkA
MLAQAHAEVSPAPGAWRPGVQPPEAWCLECRDVKVVIVGCGRVGAALARRLVAEGHTVSVVDTNVGAFNRLGDDFPGTMVVGNGIDEGVLRRAGIEGADAFVSLTPGDNRNAMAAQVAKMVFRVPRVITRLYDPIRAEVYRELGLETYCSTSIGVGIVTDYFDTGVNRGPEMEKAGVGVTV